MNVDMHYVYLLIIIGKHTHAHAAYMLGIYAHECKIVPIQLCRCMYVSVYVCTGGEHFYDVDGGAKGAPRSGGGGDR